MLSPALRKLVALMQDLNFGFIECLGVQGGQPVLAPLPRIIREHKFGGENGPRPELSLEEFSLKPQICELFALMAELQDGTIDRIEVKNGLPFRMLVTESAAR